MRTLSHLFEHNQKWAESIRRSQPDFFEKLSLQQAPDYLWIGCSDSRVPANEIVGLAPGELFVHRNVANIVTHTDFNCLSVIQYAVEMLKVRHIIVCGHYGCGGISAAISNSNLGLIDNWLRNVQDVRSKHKVQLDALSEEAKIDCLCELNVIEQVTNVSRSTIVQKAWEKGQALSIHGWIYSVKDGLLQDLSLCVSQNQDVALRYGAAVAASLRRER